MFGGDRFCGSSIKKATEAVLLINFTLAISRNDHERTGPCVLNHGLQEIKALLIGPMQIVYHKLRTQAVPSQFINIISIFEISWS